MRLKFISILLFICFLISACTNTNMTFEENLNDLTFQDFGWSDSIIKYDDHIYYVSTNGIYRDDQLLINKERIRSIYIYNNDIYYMQCDEDCDRIYRMADVEMQSDLIWDTNKLSALDSSHYSDRINDFMVYDDMIYISSSINVLKYDMKNGITQMFVDDVNNAAVLNDNFYFTDHANRTFTIYSKNVNTGVISMVRGKGKTYAEGDGVLYDEVIAFNDKLFYTTRAPYTVCLYNENGIDNTIADFSENDAINIIHLYSNGTELYAEFKNENQRGYLYKYDPSANEFLLVKEIDYIIDNYGFAVIDNYLIYCTSDNHEDPDVNELKWKYIDLN